ncbi:MAG: polymerase delta prime subunit, partial [Bryobacterales bacterium]|nr:polymerase delta prime subunit [Bryobacterales bacterium]
MFEDFWGNAQVTRALERMILQDRIAQTLLFAGPEGVGKATLARRFAAQLLGDAAKIDQDDLSLEHNLEIVAARERWPADKRNQDPLLFASHPDFVTFAPDGPLRQISIEQ